MDKDKKGNAVTKFIGAPKIGEKIKWKWLDRSCDAHRGDLARIGARAIGVNPDAAEAMIGSNIKRPEDSCKRSEPSFKKPEHSFKR